ncbi:hypothetical protein BC628DRAFT_1417971 [Trametes gibbosa]|nr:hypothetical protein BC628DRAFT_1417971 [Trametes gibbosa]
MSASSSAIALSSDSEEERELARQLEEKRNVKAACKAAQAAEEEKRAAEKVEEKRRAAKKAEEERARAEKVAGKQVACPATAKADLKGLPLVEPATSCDACKAAGTECLFWCGTCTSSCIACQEERKKPCLGARGLPDNLQQCVSRKEGAPKCKRKADDSEGGTPKKPKKTQKSRGSAQEAEGLQSHGVQLPTLQLGVEMELWLAELRNPDHVWAAYPGQLSLVELLHALLGEVQGLQCKFVHYTQELVGVQEQCDQAITEAFYAGGQLESDKAEFTPELLCFSSLLGAIECTVRTGSQIGRRGEVQMRSSGGETGD